MMHRLRWPLLLAAILLAPSAFAVPFWGATVSRAPETPLTDLRPGEYIWNPAAAGEGPVVVVVSLDEQRGYVYRNGVLIGVTTTSSGKSGHDTPTGIFVVLQKDKDHHSSIYNNAAMPFTQRLTWGGVALHAGGLPGYPSSHGCVHLPSKFAEELFAVSPMGMTVVVIDGNSTPTQVAHPPAFAPVDPVTGLEDIPGRLKADEPFRFEPDKSPVGPVSVIISGADLRAIVMRNGKEIGRTRISLRNSSVPLGTHAFVMTQRSATGSLAPEAQRWMALAMPGHSGEAGAILSSDTAQRVALPPAFVARVAPLLEPGTTLFVTDAPILTENVASNFTVLSNGAPD
jgi:L,D-transpeptidase catalytic domain